MKRFNKTVVSLATAGALGFGVAPTAFAQDAQFGDLPVTPSEGATSEGATYVDTYPALAPEGVIGGGNNEPAQDNTLPKVRDNSAAVEYVTKEENGVTYALFADANGARLWYPINANREPVRADGTVVPGLTPAMPVTPGEVTTDPADIAKAVAAVVGAGVGAAIIINGVKYFLNKDGKTLVETPERVHMDPTPEEKAKSEQLIKENAGQINAENAQNERGIAAATGVNKIPAALMTLLLASVLAAAAFLFGRRQLV